MQCKILISIAVVFIVATLFLLTPAEASAADSVTPTAPPISTCESTDYEKPTTKMKLRVSDEKMENLHRMQEDIFTTVRAVPNFPNGKVRGMKVLSVKPGSFFEVVGLTRGDIVFEVDGKELDVKHQGITALNELAKNKRGTFKVLRNCKPILIQVK